MRGGALAGLLALVVLGTASCGGSTLAPKKSSASRPHVGIIAASAVSGPLDGLSVQAESVKSVLTNTVGTYAKAVGLWSLRQNHLVQATLEVVELSPSTPRSSGFQASLVNQITGGVPTEVRLSGHNVFLASGIGSGTSTWFNGEDLFILTTRSQFATPRSLLEATLGVHLS